MTRILVSLVLAFAVSASLPAQDKGTDAQIEQVLKDWKARQDRVQSVRYKLIGTEESMGKPLMQGAPAPIPGARPVKVTVLIDLVNKRYRLDEDLGIPSQAHDRYVRRVTTTAYDGKISQLATPQSNEERSKQIPDLTIAKGNLTQIRVDTYLNPVFHAHGIVPIEQSPLGPGRFPTSHEAEDFRITGKTIQRGRQCAILRSISTSRISDELWIDFTRQSSITRQVYWQGKEPWYRLDIEHQETPNGWLPQRWVTTWSVDGSVRNITKLEVMSIDANPTLSDEEFTLPITPGMVVKVYDYPGPGKGLDPSQPAKTTIHVDPDGSLNEIAKEGFKSIDGRQLPPERDSANWWWIISTAFVLTLLLLFFWRRRVRRI